MNVILSQITGDSFVQRFVPANNKKYQNSPLSVLCEEKPPMAGGFLSRKAGNAENVSMLRHHHNEEYYCLSRHDMTSSCFEGCHGLAYISHPRCTDDHNDESFNSLRPSNAILRNRCGLTLSHVNGLLFDGTKPLPQTIVDSIFLTSY